ncbi:Uncharacterized protein BM_BM14758 [Brugia malayi]|uniref:Bm14758 n=1 Tax=Brugia malayi TaxID=6279 RepID=A0A4E9EVF1_BRUMA|nr:Uncharacterized protein BM_BM14758 [Brugia malayi]VIO88064.1 Uncharacterized protein BM_BM14758 [Brugia malayi]
MFRSQQIARLLLEKEELDDCLLSDDHSEWYCIDRNAVTSYMQKKFHQFSMDDGVWYTFLTSFLSMVLTKTSINGVLGRGGMHLFSLSQLQEFLDVSAEWVSHDKELLDLGAGDGQITTIMAQLYRTVSVTEASKIMEWRLKQRGFKVVPMNMWYQYGTYHLVSALNLLDRHYNPSLLLAQLYSVTLRSESLLLLTVVLPLHQYVEFHPTSRANRPDVKIAIKGETFEEQAGSLVADILEPAGFELLKWGKLPYLSEGDFRRPFYHLDDAVFLLKPRKISSARNGSSDIFTENSVLNRDFTSFQNWNLCSIFCLKVVVLCCLHETVSRVGYRVRIVLLSQMSMTDSDTESFHSAVDSLSDRDDASTTGAINQKNEEVGEGKRVDAARDNKYEFGGSNETQNKYSDNKSRVTEANRKKQMFRNLTTFDKPSKCRGVQEFRIDSHKMSRIGSKGSEWGLVSEIMNNVDDHNITGKTDRSEEKITGGHDGWDDWELDYSGKDGNDGGILDENCEPSWMRTSDVENGVITNSKSKAEIKTKEVTNKSFWDWAEFGDVVAAVGEGLTNISSAVESGLGLPAPAELVRNQSVERSTNNSAVITKEREEVTNSGIKSYGKLFAGFGANVVTGSLDVLEALGKKTFEKLTVPEQGSEKRRFIFEPKRGQNLSEVLRELRENRAEEAALETSYISKRELTFIDSFEKFSGMLHLEGLEMLSKNHLRKIPPQRRSEVNGIFADDLANTLEEYQENQQEDFVEDFKEILLSIPLPYNDSGLIDSYRRCKERLERSDSSDQIFELFLECLADFTAESVQSVHKLGQLLLITNTTVKQEPFSEFHSLIGRQISFFSNQFAQHISAVDTPSEEIEELVTAVFLAAGDSFSYVQQSFRLLRPLLIL